MRQVATSGAKILFALTLLVSGASIQPQTRPSAAIGYSAAERRLVDAQLTRSESARNKLANALGLSRQLVRAIAQEVGFANPGLSDRQVLEAVEGMAKAAKSLQSDNAALRAQIEKLEPGLRNPAIVLLDRAELALEAGQLATAEAIFAELRSLHWGERREAENAWASAVEAEARVAELRQNFAAAEYRRLEASRLENANSRSSSERAFKFALDAALSRFDEGQTFGNYAALWRASEIIDNYVIPLFPSITDTKLLWEARYEHTRILRSLGDKRDRSDRDGSMFFYKRALESFDLSTEILNGKHEKYYALSLQARANILLSISTIESRREAIAAVNSAIKIFEDLLKYYPLADNPYDWATVQSDRGNAYGILGEVTGGRAEVQHLETGLVYLRDALTTAKRINDDVLWAHTLMRIGGVEGRLGDLKTGQDRVSHWRAAEDAFSNALTVYGPDNEPHQHEFANSLLKRIRAALAEDD